MNKTKWKWLTSFFALVVLAGAGYSFYVSYGHTRKENPYAIVHARISGTDLYIPKAYLRFGHTSVGTESGLIQAFYPGDAPVIGTPSDLLKRGEWYKNVLILFTDIKKYKDIQITLNGKIETFQATKITGNQYGLIYKTQPDDVKNDYNELWIEQENGQPISFIECGKKISEITIPQCSHYFHNKHFWLQVLYDKRLLPEWHLIQGHVLALLKSFKSPESASEFVAERLQKITP